MNDRDFRKLLSSAILSRVQPQRGADLQRLCDALRLPFAPRQEETKGEYVRSRLRLIEDEQLDSVAEAFVSEYPFHVTRDEELWTVQENLWRRRTDPTIPKKYRHLLSRRLGDLGLYIDGQRFLDGLRRLWIIDEPFDDFLALRGESSRSLAGQIKRHVIDNPDDWPVEHLFEVLGAFDVSDRRFAALLEMLASPDVRPDEESQRAFAELVNSVLSQCAVEFRETGTDGGYPVFAIAAIGASRGRPKNLIFASTVKPDIRFRDAVNNDIEIVSNADKVLVYDRPIPIEGLRWRDLQHWWAETNNCDANTAKRALYHRLWTSLPTESPPQQFLFKTFFQVFKTAVPDLPALLPEVWLHWDPKTVRERGTSALLRFRMDFLMLFAATRIVLEVDGTHHFSNDVGRADPDRYARMMSADRELRLSGYEVYRFGAAELRDASTARIVVETFFSQLFKKHSVHH